MRINVSIFPLPKFSRVLPIVNTSTIKDVFNCLLTTYQNHLENFKGIEIPRINLHPTESKLEMDRLEESVNVKGFQVIPVGSLV